MNIIRKIFKPYLGVDADVKLSMIVLASVMYSVVLYEIWGQTHQLVSVFSGFCLVSGMFSSFCLMTKHPTNKSNVSLILTLLFLSVGFITSVI